MVDIEALTRSAQHMEALPASVTRLMALTSGDHWNLDAVEQVVRTTRERHEDPRNAKAGESERSPFAVHLDDRHDAVAAIRHSQDEVGDGHRRGRCR